MARHGFYYVVQDLQGNVIGGANISVYVSGTTTPAKVYLGYNDTIYVDTPPQTQSKANGEVKFWLDDADYPVGTLFDIVIQKDTILDTKTGIEIIRWGIVKSDLSNITSLGNILNLDGSGSGLDADMVDGIHEAQIVRTDVAKTITVQHTFDPTTAGAPFVLGTNAQGQLVTGLNADKVDGFDASQTPTANTIPVSNNTGKLNLNWIPQGSGSGLNADQVDGFHASQTPTANTIPVADNTGKLNLNWIPQGSGSGLNADQVDGFHASQTPTANTIPVAGADGKLNAGWLPAISSIETYSRLTVGTSLPASPQHNDLFYNTSDNTLRKYDARTNTWTTIDWQTIVRASPEWQAGRLRINSSTGRLEISPDGTNWYECIPAVGSQAIELQSDSFYYHILPATTVMWLLPPSTSFRVNLVVAPSGIYDLVIENKNNISAPSVYSYLYPNNTSISSSFSGVAMYYSSEGGSGFTYYGNAYSGFILYSQSPTIKSRLFIEARTIIFDTLYKWGGASSVGGGFGSGWWHSNNQTWIYFGTLSFPVQYSGKIIVKRVF